VSQPFFSFGCLAGEMAKIYVFSSDKKLTHCWLGQAVLFARDRFPSQREKISKLFFAQKRLKIQPKNL